MYFSPALESTATIHAPAHAFVAAFARRIEAGILPGSPRRVQYEVVRKGVDGLRFRAVNWWTALAVGLNDVDVAVTPDGRVRYAIRYWRWAGYCIVLGAGIGIALMATFVMIDIRHYLEAHPQSAIPWLSMNQNVAIGWAMALFWGFVWPWLLIALYKRPLRRLMNRIIAEVDTTAQTGR